MSMIEEILYMDLIKGLNTKTVLEHLIFLSNKNVVTVSRELQITPQQFTDWIKNRRPIPADRLLQLERYFDIPSALLVDEKRFARHLSVLNGIELEIMVAANRVKSSRTPEEKEEVEARITQLKEEKQKQIRVARLSALLEKDDPKIMRRIDNFLSEMEVD
jgi:hypothetical protein